MRRTPYPQVDLNLALLLVERGRVWAADLSHAAARGVRDEARASEGCAEILYEVGFRESDQHGRRRRFASSTIHRFSASPNAPRLMRDSVERGNVTEALSAARELQFVGLAEALALTLLLADGEDARYERAALRWHARFAYETKNVDIRESLAVLALLTAIPANRLAAAALAELFSRRRSLERCAEALVAWAREA
jgi:hypothetical protein